MKECDCCFVVDDLLIAGRDDMAVLAGDMLRQGTGDE